LIKDEIGQEELRIRFIVSGVKHYVSFRILKSLWSRFQFKGFKANGRPSRPKTDT